MKKLHISAFALLFTLIICVPELVIVSAEGNKRRAILCVPELVVVSAEGGAEKSALQSLARRGFPRKSSRQRAILTRQMAKQHFRKSQIVSLQKQLVRAIKTSPLAGFTREEIELISSIHFMCICPISEEFSFVYEGLKNSGFSPKNTLINLEKLKGKLYSEEVKELWEEAIKKPDTLIEDRSLQPICFFERDGEMLCLAHCGKHFSQSTSFASNSKIFVNLRHVLVCGICGCSSSDSGMPLWGTTYAACSGTIGKPKPKEQKELESFLTLEGENSYFEVKQIFSCESTSLLEEFKVSVDPNITPAMIFSFDNFVEDRTLSQNVTSLASDCFHLKGAIDMESAPMVGQFCARGCTFHAFRTVSDKGASRSKEGKKTALENLKKLSGSAIDCWMSHAFTEQDKLSREKQDEPSRNLPMIRPGVEHNPPITPSCKSPRPGDSSPEKLSLPDNPKAR